MNVAEMLLNVNAECHPITNVDVAIRRWLDRGQKVVGSKREWSWLRQHRYAINTVASQSEYALSALVDLAKTLVIYDETNDRFIRVVTETQFRRSNPNSDGDGDAFLARFVRFDPVVNQPTSTSTLSFTSDSAADTAVLVHIQGRDANDILIGETITLNGVGAVVSARSYKAVMSLSKSAETVGLVTVTSNAGVVQNVIIAPSDRSVSHPVFAFHDTPDSVANLFYDFTMKLPTIKNDNDISLIPEQYHDAVELYAIHRCYNHLNNPTMGAQAFQEFQARIQDMKQDDTKPGGIVTMESSKIGRFQNVARLPSNFPLDQDN